MPRTEEQRSNYKNPDNDPRGDWTRTTLYRKEVRKERCFELTNPKGRTIVPPPGTSWRVDPESFREYERDNRIWWGADGDGDLPFLKRFLTEVAEGIVPSTWWEYEFAGSNRNATVELRSLFEREIPFDTPKPPQLVRRLLQIATSPGDGAIVLDFFAGSGTTAQAVLELNREDGGNRRFVLVQLPEPIRNKDYPTIADICKERVRRVIKKLEKEDAGKLGFEVSQHQDQGFRVFKLAESNFIAWNALTPHAEGPLLAQLEKHVDHIRDDRTADDILYELLLKSGFPLTTAVEKQLVAEKAFYNVAGGVLVICLERELSLELIRSIASMRPERVVCLDQGFAANDQLKANAVQTFKTKGVVKFQTV